MTPDECSGVSSKPPCTHLEFTRESPTYGGEIQPAEFTSKKQYKSCILWFSLIISGIGGMYLGFDVGMFGAA